MVRWSWVNFQCRGASYNFDDSRARAYCACNRCGWGCLDIFTLLYPFSSLPPSLWETARYRLKYCLKGPQLLYIIYLDRNELKKDDAKMIVIRQRPRSESGTVALNQLKTEAFELVC